MAIHERRARLSAMLGAIMHAFILLSLFFPFAFTHSAFFPGQTFQTSGWETILSNPLSGLFLASIFWPLLLYLRSWWILSRQKKEGWRCLAAGPS